MRQVCLLVIAGLMGCAPPASEPTLQDTAAVIVEEEEEEPALIEWFVEPDSLALGETPVDEPASGVITVTNTGDLELQVLDIVADSDDELEVSLDLEAALAPGASGSFDLVWTPVEPGTLDTELSFSVGVSADDAESVSVPLSGTALGGVATLSASSYDFGDVGVGCEVDAVVTLTNTGTSDLQVDRVRLDSVDGYVLYAAMDLPWVLGPFESHEQRVKFEPTDRGLTSSALWFETDVGTVGVELQATGVVDEERSQSFDIGEQDSSTIIFNVNETAIPGASAARFSVEFEASLPTFFETLLDHDASFRAAFVWSVMGFVDGEHAYIDESFTSTEAAEAALAMLESGARGGDNDANFVTLLAAINSNSDWLFEDESWSESQLSLVTVQNDMEQSGGLWSNWVSDARAYKDDDEDIVFHAVAGPIPSGCSGAEAFRNYDQAVSDTGGTFISICSKDWESVMTQLAVACIDNPQGIYVLDSTPIDYSIEVSYDGVLQTEGWSYDESTNSVIVDDDALPVFGSTVTIAYWTSSDCG